MYHRTLERTRVRRIQTVLLPCSPLLLRLPFLSRYYSKRGTVERSREKNGKGKLDYSAVGEDSDKNKIPGAKQMELDYEIT